jgi:hypothetical protein
VKIARLARSIVVIVVCTFASFYIPFTHFKKNHHHHVMGLPVTMELVWMGHVYVKICGMAYNAVKVSIS